VALKHRGELLSAFFKHFTLEPGGAGAYMRSPKSNCLSV
jgi:hypothetical protein